MKINFYLPKRENVDLKLFDIRGRLIESIVSGEYGEGSHLLSWSPSSTGLRLSNGIYIVELNTPNQRINKKVLYLKYFFNCINGSLLILRKTSRYRRQSSLIVQVVI